MTLLAGAVWTIVDDDGSGTTGTPANAAWVAAVKASIETVVHSAANPTVTPEDTIDEVVAARDGQATLLAKIDAIDAAIAAITINDANVTAIIGQQNIANNDIFRNWPQGDTIDPAHWLTLGAGGTVQRTGSGLADTTRKIGPYAARIRRVAADTTLAQTALNSFTTSVNIEDVLRGALIGFGAWVRSTSIGGGRLYISDGIGTTYGTALAAANTWEWLTVSRTINAAATELTYGVINDVNGADVYLSGATVAFVSLLAPTKWVPNPTEYVTYSFVVDGNAAVAATRFVFSPPIPGIVEHVQLYAGTAPTGADLIVDVNTWDGAAYTSMFTAGGRPRIGAAAVLGGGQPDGTYARRCFSAGYGVAGGAGQRLSIDIDQVGSGVTGANLTILVRMRIPIRLFENALDASFF